MSAKALDSTLLIATLQDAGLLLDQFHPKPTAWNTHTTDTRKAADGDLLICYRGVSFDAHKVLPDILKERKNLSVIVEDTDAFRTLKTRTSCALLVKDSREAWSYIASLRAGQPEKKLKCIAVTGTNGKTSTVWFVRQLLKAKGQSCLTLGTLGIFLGDAMLPGTHTTPDPDELFLSLKKAVDQGISWMAMEVSSHAIAQRRLGPLAFDAVAFTSFSRDHLDFHPTMDDYFAAKWELISRYREKGAEAWLSTTLKERLPTRAADIHRYGASGSGDLADDDFRFDVKAMNLSGTEVELMRGTQRWTGKLGFGGDFVIDNFTAAFALLQGMGLPMTADWASIQAVPGRFEPVPAAFDHGLAVIVDYAHTPDALEKVLSKLRTLTEGKLWVVFGCGGDRDRGKRPIMGQIAADLSDCPVLTSDNPRTEDPLAILDEIAAGMQSKAAIARIEDRREAIAYALKNARKGDCILIAGKGHEDYQIIGKDKFPFDDRLVAAEILAHRNS